MNFDCLNQITLRNIGRYAIQKRKGCIKFVEIDNRSYLLGESRVELDGIETGIAGGNRMLMPL